MRLYNNEYTEHFIGTIVWKADDGNTDNLSVIDGQQRLTTMFLFLLAMRHNSLDEVLNDELDNIMFNKFTNQNRLTPIKSDNEIFKQIVNNKVNLISKKSSRIYANYHYFYEYIKNRNLDLKKLYDNIGKLSAIKMELHQYDNPQVIFESINSTGMGLSIADLIRNYLLMNEDYKVQTMLFEKYWYQFEKKLGVDKLIAFFEHYLSINISYKAINRNNMYTYFKQYFMDNKFSAETLLSHLEPYVEVYSLLCDESSSIELSSNLLTKRINHLRNSIIKLENTTVYMFLMPTLLDFKKNVINEEELIYSFELVLSYIFRRSMVGLSTNVLQGIFRRLYKQALDISKNHSWKNAVNHVIVTTKINTTAYFPPDEVFFDSLHSRNLYGKYKYIDYLLIEIENDGNKSKLDSEALTIEHVMPQTTTPYWRGVLGDNWKELHEENVNDLGNLTLTSYNSELSNQDFTYKKAILIQERHIKINDYFHNIDKWDDLEIQNRGRIMAKEALNIWRYPEIDVQVTELVHEAQYNSISVADLVVDYFPIKPNKLILDEQEISVTSIRELFDVVLTSCILKNKEVFEINFLNNGAHIRNSRGDTYFIFSDNIDKVCGAREIVSGIYYDSNRSGESLFSLINQVLVAYDFNPEEVIIKYYK